MVLMGSVYLMLFIRLAVRRHIVNNRIEQQSVERSNARNLPVSGAGQRRVRQIALAKMLFASYLWFCLCFLPGPVILTSFPYFFARYVMLQVWVTRTLMLFGYAASPVSTHIAGILNGQS